MKINSKGKSAMKNFKIFFTTMFLMSFTFVIPSLSQVGLEWTARYDGPGSNDDASFVINSGSNTYVLGKTGVASGADVVLIKYGCCGDTVWVKKYNGPSGSEDIPAGISLDTSGNVYVTAITLGFGTGYNIATLKYDPSGNQQWARIYNGTGNGDDKANDIKVSSSGVYVAGESFEAGTGLDFLTIKYDLSGTQQWAIKKNGTANSTDWATDIHLKSSGGNDTIYVTGSTIGTGTLSDYLTIKYNSSGTELWAKTYNGPTNNNDNAQSIGGDQTGNVYVTGRTFSTTASFDYATVKYTPSGVESWVRTYQGEISNGTEIARKLEIDSQGNIWITGYSSGIGTLFDYATIKYNPAGVQQFVKRYNASNGNDYAYSLDTDGIGNAYVTGQSTGIGTGNDYATIKYNQSGDSVWVKRFNGTGNGSDIARSVYVDNLLNVYVTGQSFGTTNDIVTIKYSQSNPGNLFLTLYIQGFYDELLNTTRRDTVKINLKNSSSPYNTIDFYKAYLSATGTGTFTFSNAVNGTNYYIATEHRNALETWSSNTVAFSSGSLTYDFSTNASQAYGNNQVQIDASPVKFGIYSGDVNRDGTIDVSDGSLIDNDALNFATGYLPTDVNGDGIVDVADAVFADNNTFNFVSKITP